MTQKRKTPAQLDREIAQALKPRPLYDTTKAFWDVFEDAVIGTIATWGPKHSKQFSVGAPGPRAKQVILQLGPDEPPEVLARRVRDASEEIAREHGIQHLNWNSGPFQMLRRHFGIKPPHTLAKLRALYAALGG